MHKNVFLTVVASTLALAACQSANVPGNSAYNPQTQARIRLYGQNQKPTIMKYTQNQKRYKVNVGGSLGDAFSSLVGAAKSHSIGIPQTRMVQEMSRYNGILSKVYYQEFVIPAGVPVSVHNSFIGLANTTPTTRHTVYEGSCDGNAVTFTPAAGQDYEVVPSHNSAACGVTVLQVDAAGATQRLPLH